MLTDILRGEWGFDGYVTSDCGGVISLWESHHTQPDEVSAAAAALNAGVDLECSDHLYKRHLKEALEKGMVTQ
jgi:beta-glucosidase